ncbi:PKD domain-containing protein [Thiofilum flexile]|uniref:PKD domain-containing protein n=1 Tax=Thiofilum flexile TaxID=125627 RepID=UPI00035E387B|nr:hypothetical protein [Thiofilum flexile]
MALTSIPIPKSSLGRFLSLIIVAILMSGCEDQLDDATRAKIEQQFGNTFPKASAGLNQTVTATASVLLDGSGSRDNEGGLQYFWQQKSGTSVALFNSNTSKASFIAPNVTTTETLTFQLVVTDNQGWPAADTINILINPKPAESNVLTGKFIASPQGVSGLSYKTATQSGMTNTAGEFKYLAGESISFKVGGIELGQATAQAQLSPFDLVGIKNPPITAAETSKVLRQMENSTTPIPDANNLPSPFEVATNIAAFLQALDTDSNLSNGISIPTPFTTLAQDKKMSFNTHSSQYFNHQPDFKYLIGLGRAQGLWGGVKPLMNYAKVLDYLYSGLGLKPTIPKVASDWRDYSNVAPSSVAEVYDFDELKQQLNKQILFYKSITALPTTFDSRVIYSYNKYGSLAQRQGFIIYDGRLMSDIVAEYNQNNWLAQFSQTDSDIITSDIIVTRKYWESYGYNPYGYLTSVISADSYNEPSVILSGSHDYSYTTGSLVGTLVSGNSTTTVHYLRDALGRELGYSSETKNELGKVTAQSSSTMDWPRLTKTITSKEAPTPGGELITTQQMVLNYDAQLRVIASKKFKDTNKDKVWDKIESYQAQYDSAGNRTYYAEQLDSNGDGKIDQNKRETVVVSTNKLTLTQEQDTAGDGIYNVLTTEERSLDSNGNWINKKLTRSDATTTYQERGYKNYSSWFPLYSTGAETDKKLIIKEFFTNNGISF